MTASVQITTEEQLRAVVGTPLPRVMAKDRTALSPDHRAFVAAAPFCAIGTSAADGTCDVSPKGDPAGSLAYVVDDRTLAIAERPGNRRADGYVNILSNPRVGLLFLVPGRGDTLRINGRARILTDAPYREALIIDGHLPKIILEVQIEQVFFHCSKAFLRSKLWDPDTWAPQSVPPRAEIAHRLERPEDSLETLQHYYDDSVYARKLYREG